MGQSELPQVNELWRHFKGGVYRICSLVWGAEGNDLVLRVVYQEDGEEKPIFSRPIANFVEPLETGPRFRKYHG